MVMFKKKGMKIENGNYLGKNEILDGHGTSSTQQKGLILYKLSFDPLLIIAILTNERSYENVYFILNELGHELGFVPRHI